VEISNSAAAALGPAVDLAVQKQMLDQMRTQGADLVGLIATTPAGSVNSPTQGRFLDVRV
jgi:hypothetical protein